MDMGMPSSSHYKEIKKDEFMGMLRLHNFKRDSYGVCEIYSVRQGNRTHEFGISYKRERYFIPRDAG